MNKIDGVVFTTSPLHVAAFESARADEKKNIRSMMQQYVFADGERYSIPYFPANDIRGRLRRKGARYVLLALENQGIKVSRPLYSGLMSSALTESIGDESSLEELQRARRNLYMGVFGGGARMISTRFYPADMVPIMRSTIGAGMVPSSYDIDLKYHKDGKLVSVEHGYSLMNRYQMVRRDDVLQVEPMDDLLRFIEDAENVIPEYQAQILGMRQDRKAAKKKKDEGQSVSEEDLKKRDSQNIYGYWAISPGVPMYFNLRFDDLTEAQVGLLVSAIRDMFSEPIGGVVRAGMGRTNPRGLSMKYNDEHYPLFDEDESSLRLSSEMEGFVAAMKESLQKMDPRELLSYFIPAKEAKKLLNEAA